MGVWTNAKSVGTYFSSQSTCPGGTSRIASYVLKVRTYQQPPLPETWFLVNSLGDLSEMPRRLLGLSLLLGADTMDDPPTGACSVVGDVLDNRLEGLGLLVEGRLLTSVASMCYQSQKYLGASLRGRRTSLREILRYSSWCTKKGPEKDAVSARQIAGKE